MWLADFYRAIGFDVGEARAHSRDVLKLLGLPGAGSRIAMSLGRSRVDLESFDHPGAPIRAPLPPAIPFSSTSPSSPTIGAAWRRACEAGATPISRARPVTLPQSAGGVTAVKFRDPEGHPLEFLQFPPGANSDWRARASWGSTTARSRSAMSRPAEASMRMTGSARRLRLSITARRRTRSTASMASGRRRADDPCQQAAACRMLGYRHPVGRTLRPAGPKRYRRHPHRLAVGQRRVDSRSRRASSSAHR